jgi:hypothetical protein
MVKLKLVYGGTVRKFQINDENCFANFQSLISEIVNDKFTPTLRYLDEDEDWITISTESDLLLCFQTMDFPKIHIIHPNGNEICSEVSQQGDVDVRYQLDSVPGSSILIKPDSNDCKAHIPDLDLIEDSSIGQQRIEQNHESSPAYASSNHGATTLDWNVLVGDFLTHHTKSLQMHANNVYKGVQEGKDVKTLVMDIIRNSSFCNHPFIRKASTDFEKMLDKINHMSVLLLKAGTNGLQLAVPLILRGYANMKAGANDGMIDLAPVFKLVFPEMTSWLKSGLADEEEVTFDLGKVMRFMTEKQIADRQPQAKEGQDEKSLIDSKVVIHHGVTCDICNVEPIIGIRYKCMTCVDFDMCEICHKGNHPKEHPMIFLQKPAPHGSLSLQGGHFKGATEFFKPKSIQNWEPKKWPESGVYARDVMEVKQDYINRQGQDFCVEKRRSQQGCPWRRRYAGPRFGPGRLMHRPPMYIPGNVDDSDSSSSISSSSSSEEEYQHSSIKRSKKLQRQLRKLKKEERKVRCKVSKLLQKRVMINRSLSKLQAKEHHILTKIANLTGTADFPITPLLPLPNNPGEDPNPNIRPFAQSLLRSHRYQRPFYSKRLLEETKEDVSKVTENDSNASNWAGSSHV